MSKDKTSASRYETTDDNNDYYRVGYRQPPQHTRWKKGQSGNPAGRTKGSLNLSTVKSAFENVLLVEDATLTGKYGSRTVTRLEGMLARMYRRAIDDDKQAERILIENTIKLAVLGASAEVSRSQTEGDVGADGKDILDRHIERENRRRALRDAGSNAAEKDGSS